MKHFTKLLFVRNKVPTHFGHIFRSEFGFIFSPNFGLNIIRIESTLLMEWERIRDIPLTTYERNGVGEVSLLIYRFRTKLYGLIFCPNFIRLTFQAVSTLNILNVGT